MTKDKQALLDAAVAKSVGQIAHFISPLMPVDKLRSERATALDLIPMDSCEEPDIELCKPREKYLFETGGMVRLGKVKEMSFTPQSHEHIIPKALADRLAQRESEMLADAMYGSAGYYLTQTVTANVAPETAEPLTVEGLRATIEKVRAEIGQLPMFVSSAMLPTDSAITFTFEGREFGGAHPDLWKQVDSALKDDRPIVDEFDNYYGSRQFDVIDIDEDTPDARKARGTFYHAMAGAMLGEKK